MTTTTRDRIGATDVAAILGLSPWRSAADVQARILAGGEAPDDAGIAALRGLVLEPRIAARLEPILGGALAPLPRIVAPHGRVWQAVSYDYRVSDAIVEIKTAGEHAHRHGWGAEPDGIPAYYRVQVQTELEAIGLAEAWVPCLVVPEALGEVERLLGRQPRETWRPALEALAPTYLDAGELRLYRIDADPALQAELIRACAAWWQRHIVEREPCDGAPLPVEASDPESSRRATRDATEEEDRLLRLYVDARSARDAAAEALEVHAEALRRAIGSGKGLTGGEHYATLSSPTRRTDWAAVAKDLRLHAQAARVDTAAIEAAHTSTSERGVLRVQIRRTRS